MIRSLVPYRLRVLMRSLLDTEAPAPADVERVKAITANQWRTLAERTPEYLRSYWAEADDESRDSLGKRRSAWLAALPPFSRAESVMELGCGAGRNLYVLQQRYPHLALVGVDINREGIEHARRRVRGEFVVGNLYDLAGLLGGRVVDLIFTMGVVIHLHPATLPGILAELRRRARKSLVFVEEVSQDDAVVKGPARWWPRRKVTGDYIQWSPNLPRILDGLGIRYEMSELPLGLQSNGARHLIIATP